MKPIVVFTLLSLLWPLSAKESTFKLYPPDAESRLIDRKIELIARFMETYDLPPIELPQAGTDEELERNLIGGFEAAMRRAGFDAEKVLQSFKERGWSSWRPDFSHPRLVADRVVKLDRSVSGVREIRVFVISRGFTWQKGKVLVDNGSNAVGSSAPALSVDRFVNDVLIPVPRIAEMLKSQHALVAIGMASAESGSGGVLAEEERALGRSLELARALAHCPEIDCPVFTSNWGRYNQGDKDQPWQREIVILGLVQDDDANGIDLKDAAALSGLMAEFSNKQRGQQLDPSHYAGPSKDPRKYVDAPQHRAPEFPIQAR